MSIFGVLTSFPGNNLQIPDTLGVLGTVSNLPVGDHIIRYIVTDDCGNSSTCEFIITIEDQTPPLAVCDEHTQVSLGIDGMVFVNALTFDDGSYDNCSDLAYKVRRVEANSCQDVDHFFDQVKFCCEDIGDTIYVILRVYDVPIPVGPVDLDFEEIHSNECLVEVLVDDKLNPACVPPPNAVVSCENFDPSLWAYGFAEGFDNCCVDTITSSVSYGQFDTLCNKGTILRTFRVFDCQGGSSQCTQKIYVEYEQDYYVHFPNDYVVNECNGSGMYGEPEFFGEDCELLAVSFHDEVFDVVPDACFKIERTWTIINWCTYNPNLGVIQIPNPNPSNLSNHPSNLVGPIVSAPGTPAPWAPSIIKVNPTDPVPTDYSSFWMANANGYSYKQLIKIIDNEAPIAIDCPTEPEEFCDLTPNDDLLWNANYWYSPTTGSHDLCEGPVDLSISGIDSCSGADIHFRYLLFLDLDQDGTMETVVSSANPPGFNNINFGNAGNPNFSGGQPRAFDHRPVAANQKYGFALEEFVNGGTKTAAVRWNTALSPGSYQVPQLPYGTHKIKWIISDGCGNEQVCEYTFVVKDCKAPTVVCVNGLSINNMPNGMITLFASDFLQFTQDNCTPTNQLTLGIVKSNESTGEFPLLPNGLPQTSVTFDCSELGTQFIQLWVMDGSGNADFCETYVIVQDNAGNCNNNSISVAGALKTEQEEGLEGANLELIGSHASLPSISLFGTTDNSGVFGFPNALAADYNYTLTPYKDDNPLNGVSTYDLVLISKHILGLEPLNSPYKMIAADANKSNSITTFDIVELRKLILGIYNELPNNTSWRFVEKDFVFSDPANPFASSFPENKSVANLQASQFADHFVALKVGDVNASAIPNTLTSSDDRTTGTLFFEVDDKHIQPGETFTVAFKAEMQVEGYQFTLKFPGLEVIDILPGEGMSLDNFYLSNDVITSSFNADKPGVFAVQFYSKNGGRLSDILHLSGEITPNEAYIQSITNELLVWNVKLRFNSRQQGDSEFELFQNVPNPFGTSTMIGFVLPEAGEAILSVFDEMGHQLVTINGTYPKGYNQISLDRAQLGDAEGKLFYYKLESKWDSSTKRMILIK
jgi:hypothetical protein